MSVVNGRSPSSRRQRAQTAFFSSSQLELLERFERERSEALESASAAGSESETVPEEAEVNVALGSMSSSEDENRHNDLIVLSDDDDYSPLTTTIARL